MRAAPRGRQRGPGPPGSRGQPGGWRRRSRLPPGPRCVPQARASREGVGSLVFVVRQAVPEKGLRPLPTCTPGYWGFANTKDCFLCRRQGHGVCGTARPRGQRGRRALRVVGLALQRPRGVPGRGQPHPALPGPVSNPSFQIASPFTGGIEIGIGQTRGWSRAGELEGPRGRADGGTSERASGRKKGSARGPGRVGGAGGAGGRKPGERRRRDTTRRVGEAQEGNTGVDTKDAAEARESGDRRGPAGRSGETRPREGAQGWHRMRRARGCSAGRVPGGTRRASLTATWSSGFGTRS